MANNLTLDQLNLLEKDPYGYENIQQNNSAPTPEQLNALENDPYADVSGVKPTIPTATQVATNIDKYAPKQESNPEPTDYPYRVTKDIAQGYEQASEKAAQNRSKGNDTLASLQIAGISGIPANALIGEGLKSGLDVMKENVPGVYKPLYENVLQPVGNTLNKVGDYVRQNAPTVADYAEAGGNLSGVAGYGALKDVGEAAFNNALGSVASLPAKASLYPVTKTTSNVASGAKVIGSALSKSEIPTAFGELSEAKNLYKQGYESGAQYHPDLTSQIKNEIETIKPQATSAIDLTPQDKAFAKELDQNLGIKSATLDSSLNYKQPIFDIPSFDKLDKNLTQIINNHTNDFGKLDQYGAKAYQLQNNIRNKFQDAPITSGNPQAADILNQARNRYFVGKKLEDIENIISKAQGTQNPSSSLKTRINTFVNDPNRIKGLDPKTVDALKDFAQNGIVSNVLGRTIGSKLLSTIVGSTAGGIPGAIVGNLAAEAGKAGANIWDMARINRLKKMIAGQQPKSYGAQ